MNQFEFNVWCQAIPLSTSVTLNWQFVQNVFPLAFCDNGFVSKSAISRTEMQINNTILKGLINN